MPRSLTLLDGTARACLGRTAVLGGGNAWRTRSMLNGHWLSGDLVYRHRHNQLFDAERANKALSVAGQPMLALLDVAPEGVRTGATGTTLKRQLRERYADLPAYARTAGVHSAAQAEVIS